MNLSIFTFSATFVQIFFFAVFTFLKWCIHCSSEPGEVGRKAAQSLRGNMQALWCPLAVAALLLLAASPEQFPQSLHMFYDEYLTL